MSESNITTDVNNELKAGYFEKTNTHRSLLKHTVYQSAHIRICSNAQYDSQQNQFLFFLSHGKRRPASEAVGARLVDGGAIYPVVRAGVCVRCDTCGGAALRPEAAANHIFIFDYRVDKSRQCIRVLNTYIYKLNYRLQGWNDERCHLFPNGHELARRGGGHCHGRSHKISRFSHHIGFIQHLFAFKKYFT